MWRPRPRPDPGEERMKFVLKELDTIAKELRKANAALARIEAAQKTDRTLIMGLREDMDLQLKNAEEEIAGIEGVEASVIKLFEVLDALAKQKADALTANDVARVQAIDAAIEARKVSLAAAVARFTPLEPSGNAPPA